ncbi:hypothetical protein GCM10011614_06350 [Novosphingobium colocasiae]|uniref:SPOR domain-containing protein n=1 Tax=Novosphingobium colocasiae TaxID=1256513 RepID=A0A918P9K6_9SPHN|nr:hypothetical protein GCM10011614_06350 [Novosphingobium colocasiae]
MRVRRNSAVIGRRARRALALRRLALPVCALLGAAGVHAQTAPVVSRPVVQPVPGAGSAALNAALSRLGRNPRDSAALLDAGNAASTMGDFAAAIGFYRRAEQIAPGDPQIKIGLAGALTGSGDPVAAIAAYDAAEKAGAAPAQIAADRGLAYDLVGDNLTAQRYYAQAPRGGPGEAGLRLRLALSQAIGGDASASELTLMPLMRQQDKPAWRTRAFALAIGGDVPQATQVVETILPGELAERIVPYLRYMPRLTRAQQAAAANLGKFPRAAEVGIDDTRIAAITPAGGFPRHMAAAAAGLVPKGEPLGSGGSKKASARTAKAARQARADSAAAATKRGELSAVADASARTAPPPIKPATATTAPEPVTLAANGELPPVNRRVELPPATALTAAAPAPSPAPVAAKPASVELPRVAVATPPARKAGPGFDLARLPQSRASAEAVTSAPAPAALTPAAPPPAVATTPAPVAAAPVELPPAAAPAAVPPAVSNPAPPALAASTPPASPAPATPAPPAPAPAVAQPAARAPQPPSLADIFADLDKPTLKAGPVSGAVDISRISPARPVVKPEPKPEVKKPAPPAHPSRIWVQVGVGRDKSAIAYDWRRMSRQASALFKGKGPFLSDYGQTNRILAGPFATEKAAETFLTQARKADIGDGAHVWISPAGQVVDQLGDD